MPLENFSHENRVRSIILIPSSKFHETLFTYKPPSDNVQRTRTVTPFTSFTELCPFEIFPMKIESDL